MIAEARRIWLKGKCNHGDCGGDLYLEQDWWGRWTKKCLLCNRAVILSEEEVKELTRRK